MKEITTGRKSFAFSKFKFTPLVQIGVALAAVFATDTVSAQRVKLKPNSVKSVHIRNGQVTSSDLSNNAVTSFKLAPFAVGTDHLEEFAVTTEKVADSAITTNKLAVSSVTTDEIANFTITGSDIGIATITNTNLAAGSVQSAQIADSSVTGTDIALGTITANNLASQSVDVGHIASTPYTWRFNGSVGVNTIGYLDAAVTIKADVGDTTALQSEMQDANLTFYHYSGGLVLTHGVAYKPGGGSWSVASDARLKKNIHDAGGVLDKVLQLRPVTFEYTDPEKTNLPHGTQIGFIAQEVEEVFPDWIGEFTLPQNGGNSESAEKYKMVNVHGFEALTVGALRELRAEKDEQLGEVSAGLQAVGNQLESIETERAALKEENRQLTQRLNELEILVKQLAAQGGNQAE